MTLNALAYRLVQHGLDRSGPGFGNYPDGVLYAVRELMAHAEVHPDYFERNGYGEPGPTLGAQVMFLTAKLRGLS